MYGYADSLLNNGSYDDAAKAYEDLDLDHPYSHRGPPRHRDGGLRLLQGPANITRPSPPPSATSRCIPARLEADLAHHIIGMSYYDQVLDPARDQTNTRKALQAYLTLVQRYPRQPLRRGGA